MVDAPTSALGSAYFFTLFQSIHLKGCHLLRLTGKRNTGNVPLQLKCVLLLTPGTSGVGIINRRTHFNYSYCLLLTTISMDNSVACYDWM